MKIVRLTTGVDAVTVPDDEVVFVDPQLSYEDAVTAAWSAEPGRDPAEVRRSVREALPSSEGPAYVHDDVSPPQTMQSEA